MLKSRWSRYRLHSSKNRIAKYTTYATFAALKRLQLYTWKEIK